MQSTLVERGLICCIALFLLGFATSAQTTVSTGSIQGTLSDPSGAASAGATVRITSKGTGQTLNLTSNPDGIYNSGGLPA
jgi:Carboxypeptidase regulatory-like domain